MWARLAALVAAAASSGGLAIAQPVQPAVLGTLGGTWSTAAAINTLGQVVGQAALANDQEAHAFLWTAADGMIDLGTLGGHVSYATVVNEDGIVAGNSTIDADDSTYHAFWWTPESGIVDVGALDGWKSWAFAVTPSGDVIGLSGALDDDFPHVFQWNSETGLSDLGSLGVHLVGADGQTLGRVYTVRANDQLIQIVGGNYPTNAFYWRSDEGLVNLGLFEGRPASAAWDVNSAGEIAGQVISVCNGLAEHGAWWTRATGWHRLDCSQLSGNWAAAINEAGDVAGRYEAPRAGHMSSTFTRAWGARIGIMRRWPFSSVQPAGWWART